MDDCASYVASIKSTASTIAKLTPLLWVSELRVTVAGDGGWVWDGGVATARGGWVFKSRW